MLCGFEVDSGEARCGVHPRQPEGDGATGAAVCGSGDQACVDALHDGHKARVGGKHDQRFIIRGGDVQGERDHGHSGVVPEPVFESRWRT